MEEGWQLRQLHCSHSITEDTAPHAGGWLGLSQRKGARRSEGEALHVSCTDTFPDTDNTVLLTLDTAPPLRQCHPIRTGESGHRGGEEHAKRGM